MVPWPIVILWVVLAAIRLAFLGSQLRDPEGLWYDYERGGPKYRMARWLDYLTLGAFSVAAAWSLWGLDAQTPARLALVFVSWLGFFLLERLPVHRFPRTNRPGALDEALVSLAVNLGLSVLAALAATVLAALFFRWRG
jgi:hypothetical protein